MRGSAPLSAAFLLILGFASAASADSIIIDFDFGGSSISFLGGNINIPPDGSITSASGSVRVPGSGLITASGGSAGLGNFNLNATLSATTFGANLFGPIAVSQPAAALGSLTGGLGNVVIPNVLLNISAQIGCTGATAVCAALSLPITLSGPQTGPLGSLSIANLSIDGGAAIGGSFSLTVGGFTAVLSLVGTEVGRTFVPVPEPNTFGLLALGLAGMAGMRSFRRRG